MKPDGFRRKMVTSFERIPRVCVCVWVCVPTLSSVSLPCIRVLLSCPPHRDTTNTAVNSLLSNTTQMCILLNGCGETRRHKVFARERTTMRLQSIQWNHRTETANVKVSPLICWRKWRKKKLQIKFVANAPYSGVLLELFGSLVLCWHGKNEYSYKWMRHLHTGPKANHRLDENEPLAV